MLHSEIFEPLLLPGETLLWTGRPARSFFFIANYLLRTGGILLLLGGFLYTNNKGFWDGASDIPHINGRALIIPLLLSALFIFPTIRSISRYRNSFYALTGRRLIIVQKGLFPVTRVFDLGQLPFATFTDGKSGIGSILFYEKGVLHRDDPDRTAYRPDLPILNNIADAGAVFQRVQKLQWEASGR